MCLPMERLWKVTMAARRNRSASFLVNIVLTSHAKLNRLAIACVVLTVSLTTARTALLHEYLFTT